MAGPDIKRPNSGNSNGVSFAIYLFGAVLIGAGIIGGTYWYKHRDAGESKRGLVVQSGLPSDFFAFARDDEDTAEEVTTELPVSEIDTVRPATDLPQEQQAAECVAPVSPKPKSKSKPRPRKQAAAKPAPPPPPPGPTFEELEQRRQAALIAAFNERRRGTTQIRVGATASNGDKVEWVNSQERWDENRDDASYPMRDRERIITEAVVIPAVLREEVNSELGGKVVAQIEKNIYGAVGRTVLIPAGSQAIGRYLPLKKAGETRLNIIWHRIITPDGINIHTADAEMADAMGRAGVTGEVDNRYFERFGIALLVSTLTAATTYSIPMENQGQAVVVQSYGQGVTSLAQTILNDHINIKPTVTIPAGSRILISPQRDIWFPKPKKKSLSILSMEGI